MESGNGSEPREPWAAGVRRPSAPSGRAPQGKQGTPRSPTRSEGGQPLPRDLVLPEPLRASRRNKHLSRGPVPLHFITQTADLEARAQVRETRGLSPCSWQCLLTGVFPGCCCLLCPVPASRAAREVPPHPPPRGQGALGLAAVLEEQREGRQGGLLQWWRHTGHLGLPREEALTPRVLWLCPFYRAESQGPEGDSAASRHGVGAGTGLSAHPVHPITSSRKRGLPTAAPLPACPAGPSTGPPAPHPACLCE